MRSSVALAKRYLSLAPTSPPKLWTAPQPLEAARIEYQDEIAGGFLKWFPGLELKGKDVFDIGCGYGGRTVRYSELGAASVVGLEVTSEAVRQASAFAENCGVKNATFILGEGENLPFPENSFDVITSYDVFEHVADLQKTLTECMRVLRPGGSLYAVFPPFYHPTGAHLDGWLSRMPWPNILFNSKTLVAAGTHLLANRSDGYSPRAMRPHDILWTLNGATIASVRRILRDREFHNHKLKLPPLFSPMNEKWKRWRMKYYAFAFKPLAHLPIVQEAFVHRIVLTVTK